MKVAHIESGLGNQMLDYCEYLALVKANPNDECYIETLIYEIPECEERICQWNGYELEHVFGIHAPNIKERFTQSEWVKTINYVRESKFWEKYWNWPVYIQEAFASQGLVLENIRGDFEKNNPYGWSVADRGKIPLMVKIRNCGLYQNARRLYKSIYPQKYTKSDVKMLFYSGDKDVLTGHRETFHNINNDIERIDKEIRECFVFPQITDDINRRNCNIINNCNSVGVHVRRGDYLIANAKYYNSGYFRRAISFMRKNLTEPTFFFFCDPGSKEWCLKNQSYFGLKFEKDPVIFIDNNRGTDSYRDMQLMSYCKHNIVTNSSFGWWGAYLNTNPEKITISPEIQYNTTHHC